MNKKKTVNLHKKIANETLRYIYNHIDTDINLDELANNFKISKFHLHKLFKKQIGINIYETIKSIRLQKASNLLLTNIHSTITEVANSCGYSSQTSFINAFKKRFNQTPTQWRQGGFKDYSDEILKTSELPLKEKFDYSTIEYNIVKMPIQKAFVLHQRGYFHKEVEVLWKKMLAWVYSNDINVYEEIGIFHDNPIITPAKDCFYTAAITTSDKININETNLSTMDIDGGLYVSFEFKGKLGELLSLVRWVYQTWLPNSGFETTAQPSFAIFRKNPVFDKNKEFDATFYLPIKYV